MGSITAPAEFEQLEFSTVLSDDGLTIGYLPRMVVEAIQRSGGGKITFRIEGDNDQRHEWLTLKEASVLYLKDRPDFTAISSAKSAVSRACHKKDIRHIGAGRTIRIDPVSFDAWRLMKRDEYLNSFD